MWYAAQTDTEREKGGGMGEHMNKHKMDCNCYNNAQQFKKICNCWQQNTLVGNKKRKLDQ
jgi:hypothetical protein